MGTQLPKINITRSLHFMVKAWLMVKLRVGDVVIIVMIRNDCQCKTSEYVCAEMRAGCGK